MEKLFIYSVLFFLVLCIYSSFKINLIIILVLLGNLILLVYSFIKLNSEKVCICKYCGNRFIDNGINKNFCCLSHKNKYK